MTSYLDFPLFLRFGLVRINFSKLCDDGKGGSMWDTVPIVQKCRFFEDKLQLIKPLLNGSTICVNIYIDRSNPSNFYDHDDLLKYLRNRLLPICNESRQYEFVFSLDSDHNATKCMLASILKMGQIDRCSDLSINFVPYDIILPIEEISTWLHRSANRKKSLYIVSFKVEGLVKIFTHLKEVFIQYLLNP